MVEWPQQHKSLATLVVLLLAAVAAAYMFFFRPRYQEVADLRMQMADIQGKLNSSGWPLDSERLTKLLEEMNRRLEGPPGRTETDPRTAIGIKNRSEAILRQSTAMFDPKIREFFGTPQHFVKEVSRLDYQEEFNQLEQRLRADDIILAEEVLGLSEDTSSAHTYQLLLHIWTLDEVLKLAKANGLRPAKDLKVMVTTDTGARRAASKVSILPVRAYFLDEENKTPYLLEFPVQLTLLGELTELVNFLGSLHAEDRFFPIHHIEMITENPASKRPGIDGKLHIHRISVNVECSAFFRLSQEAPKQHRKKVLHLPAGA